MKFIKIGGETVTAIRFSGYIAFCTESEEDIQSTLIKVDRVIQNKNEMKQNKKETKVMTCSETNLV